MFALHARAQAHRPALFSATNISDPHRMAEPEVDLRTELDCSARY